MILAVLAWLGQTTFKLVLASFALWLYKELTMGICRCRQQRLDGKVAVITGASAGLGLETAIQLAKRGCHLIMGCRNIVKAEKAVAKIRSYAPEARLQIFELQLASLKSICS